MIHIRVHVVIVVSLIIWNLEISLKFSAVLDDNRRGGSTTLTSDRFNLVNNVQTIYNLSEHTMITIQPRGVNGADEELGK